MELHFKKCYNDELAEWFDSGKADVAILDQAVLRVLTAKFRMGLFENPYGLSEDETKSLPSIGHKTRLSHLRSALESLVLLKNDGVLPIRHNARKIAVIGCHADSARFMFGGYTHFSMREGLLAHIATMAGVKDTNQQQLSKTKTYPGSNVQIEPDACEDLLGIL